MSEEEENEEQEETPQRPSLVDLFVNGDEEEFKQAVRQQVVDTVSRETSQIGTDGVSLGGDGEDTDPDKETEKEDDDNDRE